MYVIDYTLVWHDICLGHIELHVALEICRLKKLDKDLEKAVKYAWKNCVAFGLNVISGTWSKGYTDSYINVLNILRLHQTKDYKIGICCFSAKHAALRRKSKDWLARNHNNVSEWNDMSTHGLLFQWASTIKNSTQRVGLEQGRIHHHLIDNQPVLAMI